MYRIDHRNRHQEYRKHRTQDMNRIACSYHSPHGNDDRDRSDEYRQDNHVHRPEKEKKQCENNRHRQHRAQTHLGEHLHTDSTFSNRQTGNMPLFITLQPGDLLL